MLKESSMMDSMTTSNNTTLDIQNASQYTSRDGCITVIFSQMEFLPWDNPDNIISAEVETIFHRIKNNLLVILFLIGGPANIINMAVFYKQGLKDRVNLCLFALSLADELYLIVSMLHHGEQAHVQFTTKERFGPILVFLSNKNLIFTSAFGFVSPVLSTIIAIERCLCVCNPLKFQSLLRTQTMAVMITIVYITVLSLFFIACFRFRVSCIHDPTTGVSILTGVEGELYRAHKTLVDILDGFVFSAGLPWTEMIVVTISTMITIVKLRQAMTWRSETSSTISAQDVAITRMLVVNSILFIICSSPFALIRFTWFFFPEVNLGQRNQNIFLSGLWVMESFTFINSSCNVFVYYAMGSRYRETFWQLLCRGSCSKASAPKNREKM